MDTSTNYFVLLVLLYAAVFSRCAYAQNATSAANTTVPTTTDPGVKKCETDFHDAKWGFSSPEVYCKQWKTHLCCLHKELAASPAVNASVQKALNTLIVGYDISRIDTPICGETLKDPLELKGVGCTNGTFTGALPTLKACDVGVWEHKFNLCIKPLQTTKLPDTECSNLKTIMCCVRKEFNACPKLKTSVEVPLTASWAKATTKGCTFKVTDLVFGTVDQCSVKSAACVITQPLILVLIISLLGLLV